MSANELAEPIGDAITSPFWSAAVAGDLLVQRCDQCGSAQLYPRPLCVRCGSSAVRWEQASGLGTIYSATTVRMQVAPDREPPYAVALVELAEGPRLLVEAGAELVIGERVRLHWRTTGADSFPVLVATKEE